MLSGEIKARSGRRESPAIKEGDEKNGRSAYNEQFCKEENDLARKRSTELGRQVYLPSARYELQLETTC